MLGENPFLSGIGPTAPDAQPGQVSTGPGPAALNHYAQMQAEQEALRQGLHQVIRGNFNQAGLGLADAGAKAVGTGIGAALRSGTSSYVNSGAQTISSSLAGLLGTGATLYGGYEGVKGGLGSANRLNSQLRRASPQLTEGERDDLRQRNFNAAMVKGGSGSAAGLIGGALGPIGAIAGSLIGGSGGFLEASRTFKDEDRPALRTAKALGKFMRRPWKR